MSGKVKPPMDTSPFAQSRMGTAQTQDDNSKVPSSNTPETDDVSPLDDFHADLGRRLQARRSLSTPDLASLAAEPEHSVERASPSNFHTGKQPAVLHVASFPGLAKWIEGQSCQYMCVTVASVALIVWHGSLKCVCLLLICSICTYHRNT